MLPVTFEIIYEGTDITDFVDGSGMYIMSNTILIYKDGSVDYYSENLAGHRTEGCDCCSEYYRIKDSRFKNVVKYYVVKPIVDFSKLNVSE